MTWNEGNFWKAQIPFQDYFEYKFVFLEHDKVKKWENGPNRVFDFSTIKTSLEIQKPTSEDKIELIGKFVEDYTYNIKTNVLIMKSTWRP
jgi:hypothetical protein